jgi:hypothetical protein
MRRVFGQGVKESGGGGADGSTEKGGATEDVAEKGGATEKGGAAEDVAEKGGAAEGEAADGGWTEKKPLLSEK